VEKNLIIVAGGLNTRYKELSNFSKVILPFILNNETTTCLKNSYSLFDDYNRYVIVDTKFYKQVLNYIKANDLNITCIESFDHTNSFKTIYSVLDQLPNSNLLFLWSDIILDEKIEVSRLTTNIIFTKQGNYRYLAKTNNLINCGTDGNVPGVYFIKDKSSIVENKEYSDFVELFKDLDYKAKPIKSNLLELRDKETYLNELGAQEDSEAKGRYFNTFTIDKENNTITKTSDKSHAHLIKKEVTWYNKVKDYGIAPKLISNTDDSLTVEFLNGYNNFYKVLNSSNEYLVNVLIDKLNQIYKISPKCPQTPKTIYEDIKVEFYDKVLTRINSIKDMLLDFDEKDFIDTIKKSFDRINGYFSSQDTTKNYYQAFHGDLNGSNTMINGDTFKFIDPRAYFGHTIGSGPLFYELAKVYYCISGYDHFNANINYIYFDKNNYSKPKPLVDYSLDPFNKLVVGVIWICLASYIADNIMKVNISYQFGLKMIKDALKSI